MDYFHFAPLQLPALTPVYEKYPIKDNKCINDCIY